ncbi:hypothetical protein GE21DRAFT_10469 [Neurospora crassa]|uniref:Uncharacterized protein n=2 Tax=Neurospora crassa TaxID=5141 RepID=Q7S5B3_NEUCR|nr:hypothetical protein NCU02251 [Neurospora crassa OR74A]EAA30659.1 hypothetical protein NCU02251 [Neurospora crassa OR74A]KHE84882.1 hypothetical protein GE21DRAFT_10469 [Neurospora crassa]CAF05898.1 hypothetical protein B13D24.330 [Neurospora crassa]|eukprot:XP_959895.1 hypothetical protein NCU02251 [Neurospora crassa OR74A]
MTPLVHESKHVAVAVNTRGTDEETKDARARTVSGPLVRSVPSLEWRQPPDRGQPTWMGNLAARARIRSPPVDGAEASGGVVKAQPRPTEKKVAHLPWLELGWARLRPPCPPSAKAREPRGRPSPVPRLSVLFCIHSGRPSPRKISVIELLVRAGF